MLCHRCGGTGEYLGMGFMPTDCEICNNSSDECFKPVSAPPLEKINRRSKEYLTAIKNIMSLNPKMSRNDAIKLFDKTYDKV